MTNMADPSESLNGDHIDIIQSVLRDQMNQTAASVSRFPASHQNSVYLITLFHPTESQITLQNGKNGVQPIPEGTKELIFRIPNPVRDLLPRIRVRNTVAAATLAREACRAQSLDVVPAIYGWSDSEFTQGWILEQAMTGVDLSSVFGSLSPDQKHTVLKEMATIVSVIQDIRPAHITYYGGLDINERGLVSHGVSAQGFGGPFPTLNDYFEAMAEQKMALAEKSPVLRGWRDNGVKGRFEQFVSKGLAEVIASCVNAGDLDEIGQGDQFQGAFIHGDLTMDNFKVCQTSSGNSEVTAVLDFDFARIGHPLEEFMSSFYDLYAFLPGPYSQNPQNQLLHQALLHGHPNPLPQSVPANSKSQHSYGTGTNIDWELSRAWIDALVAAGGQTPKSIPGAAEICALYWFLQSLAPPNLTREDFVKVQSETQLIKARDDVEKILLAYLERWGY